MYLDRLYSQNTCLGLNCGLGSHQGRAWVITVGEIGCACGFHSVVGQTREHAMVLKIVVKFQLD